MKRIANSKIVLLSFCALGISTRISLSGQSTETFVSSPAQEKKNYISTSVFVLSSFIPDDNTYFFEIDYGRKLNERNDLIMGFNIYKYEAPMSSPWNDEISYPGHVVSYGVVLASQHYIWKDLFIDQMINPLVLDYYSGNETAKTATGFMLLCATRVGYHLDFQLCQKPFYIEAGAEISYWPVNHNVPDEFRELDNRYQNYVFSPALQFGFLF